MYICFLDFHGGVKATPHLPVSSSQHLKQLFFHLISTSQKTYIIPSQIDPTDLTLTVLASISHEGPPEPCKVQCPRPHPPPTKPTSPPQPKNMTQRQFFRHMGDKSMYHFRQRHCLYDINEVRYDRTYVDVQFGLNYRHLPPMTTREQYRNDWVGSLSIEQSDASLAPNKET